MRIDQDVQACIAIIRVDQAGASCALQPTLRPGEIHAPQRIPMPGAGSQARGASAQQALAKGFALDLSMGGPDDDDLNFRESA